MRLHLFANASGCRASSGTPDQTDERSYKRYCLRWARQLIDRLGLEDLVADDRISA